MMSIEDFKEAVRVMAGDLLMPAEEAAAALAEVIDDLRAYASNEEDPEHG